MTTFYLPIPFVAPLSSKLAPLLDFIVPLSTIVEPLSTKLVPKCEQQESLSFTTGEDLIQSISYQSKKRRLPQKETDSIRRQ
jgi:hypothetical protein